MNPQIAVPTLRPGAVHLWQANLDQWAFEPILSEDERARAARFRFERDRARFTAGRTALRLLTAAYLNQSPGDILFRYGPAGKPFIPNSSLEFNLAHSGPHALAAFTLERPIGVDIEEPRDLNDIVETARAAFSPGEFNRWQESPPEARLANFYRCWTRKEAYLKAIGEGIARRLHQFEVAFEPNEPPQMLAGAEGSWTLIDLSREPHYIAALAVAGRLKTLKTRSVPTQGNRP